MGDKRLGLTKNRRWLRALLLAAVLCVFSGAVSGCGSSGQGDGEMAWETSKKDSSKKKKKKAPKELYAEAVKKNQELSSMDMSTVVKMTMSQGEETIDVDVDMDIQMADVNTDRMKYAANGSTSLMGQTIETSVFYTGGYYYMDMMGQKIKYAMDMGQLMEQVKQTTDNGNLNVEYMKDIQAKKDGDNTILTFTADSAKMDGYVKEMMGSMGGVMSGTDGAEFTIKSAEGEMTVNKEGYYTDMKMHMDLDMTMQGETIGLKMDMTAAVHSPGRSVEVVLPDTEGYQEIDASLLNAN